MGGNADQSDGGESTQKVIRGPTWEKTGWLVYIIDEVGNQLTDTKVFYSSFAQPSAGNGGVSRREKIRSNGNPWGGGAAGLT